MPEAVILAKDTYDRIMRMLDKWEKGQIVDVGPGLKLLETGTGYEKIGFDPLGVPSYGTLNLNVCIDGASVSKTFLTTIGPTLQPNTN